MVQYTQYWTCKHEDWSSDAQTPHNPSQVCMVACLQFQHLGSRDRGSKVSWPECPQQQALGSNERPCLK